jgi:hypothetical protein
MLGHADTSLSIFSGNPTFETPSIAFSMPECGRSTQPHYGEFSIARIPGIQNWIRLEAVC